MTALSLVFLVICIFGAFAYGSATLLALRQSTAVWSGTRLPRPHVPVDRVSLTMFAVCTVWFAMNAVSELRTLIAPAAGRTTGVALAVFITTFIFPPLIMHVVYRETAGGSRPRQRWWRHLLAAMYVASPAAGAYLVSVVLGWLPRPPGFGRMIGTSFAVLFTAASLYSTVLMLARRRDPAPPRLPAQRQLGNAILALFFLMSVVMLTVAVARDRSLLVSVFERLTRTAPLLFLLVAMYFENRFEFYDLIIKRGAMLVATVVALGVAFTFGQPLLEALPQGPVRPWVAAIVVVPIAMLLPPLSRLLSGTLDRLWFGREFSPVDAVKHLLGAMQRATGEATLVTEAERRLAEIFKARVRIVLGPDTFDRPAAVAIEASTPSGAEFRVLVESDAGARRLLSEDLLMLRSLAGVFGLMLETIRLQHKRQEQELVAQDLRLQASRSELKALRAQINPHFLFNALNAIASLIHTNPGRADAAIEQLAEVFRYTLRRSDSEWAPLDQELAFARAYLEVEQARFGPRLTFVFASECPQPSPLVPSMLLQTLIENAVKHGVSQLRGPGRIEVAARTTRDTITLEVRDNGPWPEASDRSLRDGGGFGLRSVRERLAGHFGEGARVSLERDAAAGTTTARIVMPISSSKFKVQSAKLSDQLR